jgi:hypothetical protein
MYLLALLIAGLSIASIFVTPLEQFVKGMGGDPSADPAQLADQVLRSPVVKDAVGWITGADSTQADYLLEKRPALFSAIMLFLLLAIPYTTCIGGFNQTSGDIASKGLRFLLLRTERINIYLGRLVGAALFTTIAAASVIALIVIYIHLKFGMYEFWPLMSWALEGLFAVLLLSVPYLALCAWISGKIDSPFASLALCLLAAGFTVVFIMIVKMMLIAKTSLTADDLGWMFKVLPWGWKYDLLSHSFATRLTAVAAMIGFTGLFLSLGIRSFNRRDL